MNRTLAARAALGVAAVLSLAATRAAAQAPPCEGAPCVRPVRPGTHFIAELYGGGSVSSDMGFSVGGVLGFGGRPWGMPLRIYLVGEFAHSGHAMDGQLPVAGLRYSGGRAYNDTALGLRGLLPIWGPIRLFVDVMGGFTHASGQLHRAGMPALSASEWQGLGQLAGGVQLRLWYHLSLGVRAKLVFSADPLAAQQQLAGHEAPLRSTFTAGITWHF